MDYLKLPSARFEPWVKVPSTWMENYGFGYDLIHFHRPKSLAELGVYCGGSYFVLCQAVKAAGLSTACHAIDTWEGDPQAGHFTGDVYETFCAHHREHFSGVSSILKMRFDEARERFGDGSIDLLHIDGFHTYEAVREDYEKWLPKVSPNGISFFMTSGD
jgi:hypothetical protein